MNKNFNAWFELYGPTGTAKEIAEHAWICATLSAAQKITNILPRKYRQEEIDTAGAIERVVMKHHNQIIADIEHNVFSGACK